MKHIFYGSILTVRSCHIHVYFFISLPVRVSAAKHNSTCKSWYVQKWISVWVSLFFPRLPQNRVHLNGEMRTLLWRQTDRQKGMQRLLPCQRRKNKCSRVYAPTLFFVGFTLFSHSGTVMGLLFFLGFSSCFLRLEIFMHSTIFTVSRHWLVRVNGGFLNAENTRNQKMVVL